jgi:hypothetical protein
MRKWVFPLLVILSLLLPLGAKAQNSISFSSMTIEIWPEYDQPSVLVIYRIVLASSATFPADLSIRIPTVAGDPNAVAERQADGSLYSLNYSREVNGQWANIKFTTTSSQVQIEYYDPSLVINGSSHHFEYVWPGDYAITALTMQVQQPAGATDMKISPSLGPGEVGTDGLTYYTQNIGSITADQSIKITIDYQKSSDSLTVQSLPVEPSSPIPQGSTTGLNFTSILPWIVGILGAGLIIGGSIWFWRTSRQRPQREPRNRHAKSGATKPAAEASSDEESIYCSQCGKRASPGDQFCRSCGSAIHAR